MAWITPKTNWQVTERPAASDFNRIEGNTLDLYNNKITNAGDTPSILADTLANRPSPSTAGRIFIATDKGTIFRDSGSSWEVIGLRFVSPGDTVLLEALTERSVTVASSIVKQFQLMHPGRYRITGEIKSSATSGTASVTIKVEPSVMSSEIQVLGSFSTTSTSYISFTIDFPTGVYPGALINVYLTNINVTGYLRNVRVKYTTADFADSVIQN